MHRKHSKHQGLTIAEIIVAITLASIIILALAPLLIDTIRGFNRQNSEARAVQATARALSSIRLDAQRNYEFLETPLSTDTAPPAPSSEWNFAGTGEGSRTLILKLPATTLPYQNEDRELVYNQDLSDCSSYSGMPVFYTAIYYIHESNLYKRTVLDPDQPACPDQTPHQVTTCLDGGCTQEDILIESGIGSFQVDYFTNPTQTTPVPYDDLIDNLSDITEARLTVKFTGSEESEVEHSNSIRISINPLLRRE